ncbi:MAG: AAA family ATPase [Pseudomonadota bacterium]
MRYLFGEFEMNVGQRTLLRNGAHVPTEPKVFDVLLYMLENRERAVSREELFEVCWQGVFVSDGTLSRCLSRIRQALGQSRGARSPIQTLHSKGYRFVAEVETLDRLPSHPATESAASKTDQAEADEPPLPVSLDRRFVSIIHVSFQVFAETTEEEAELLLGTAQRIVDIAASHGCQAVRLPGRAVVIQVGSPRPEEEPARLGLEIAQLVGRLHGKGTIGIQTTMASGIANIHAPLDEDDREVLVGVDPIHVVAPIGRGRSVLFLDDRSAGLLAEQVEVETVPCLLHDGTETMLNSVVRAVPTPKNGARLDGMLVGRDRELLHIRHLWEKARRGMGQAVLITGEPGIGKTGLVEEFIRSVEPPASGVFHLACSPHHVDTPFYPQLVLLSEMLDVEIDTPPIRQLRVVEQFLEQFDRPQADGLPVLASLLSLNFPRRSQIDLQLDPQRRWTRTMESMVSMITTGASERPTLLWIDDIQWADPSTLATLARLSDELEDQRLLIVACGRDRDPTTLGALAKAHHISLDRLHRMHSIKLLSEMSHRGVLPAGLIGTISERSEGVPLYLREFVRMVQSRGEESAEALEAMAIPDSLQGLLASRLEATGDALAVLQWIAVIGRAAPRWLLLGLTGLDDEGLERHLRRLISIGILNEMPRGGGVEVGFDHGLMRDAAYESMLEGVRRDRHLAVAEALCADAPGIAQAEPEQVARHFAASSEPGRAAPFWQAAAEASLAKNAKTEAESLFRHALDAAQKISDPQGQQIIATIEAMLAEF